MAKLTDYEKVAVIHEGDKDYHFALYDEGIRVGDKVLVAGNYGVYLKNEPIKEIISKEEAFERFPRNIIAEVVCKVDTRDYDARHEKKRAIKRLKKELDRKIKISEINKYELYATKSPEIARLYEEYKELGGE